MEFGYKTDAIGIAFMGAELNNVRFGDDSKVTLSIFRNVDLTNVEFGKNIDMRSSDLRGAKGLENIDASSFNLEGVKLNASQLDELSGTSFLKQWKKNNHDQFEKFRNGERTVLVDGAKHHHTIVEKASIYAHNTESRVENKFHSGEKKLAAALEQARDVAQVAKTIGVIIGEASYEIASAYRAAKKNYDNKHERRG